MVMRMKCFVTEIATGNPPTENRVSRAKGRWTLSVISAKSAVERLNSFPTGFILDPSAFVTNLTSGRCGRDCMRGFSFYESGVSDAGCSGNRRGGRPAPFPLRAEFSTFHWS